MQRLLFSLLILLCIVSNVAAQSDCPALVEAALNAASEACASLSRNQACYGNVTLQATPRAEASDFAFEQAGDIADVADIQSLQLSSMSLTDATWGIALMQLQANLPDTPSSQSVTVLLFGDVTITNSVTELIEHEVTATGNVNVRLRPTTAENNVIASLSRGEIVTANGRLGDGSWIRIIVNADTREVGWVSADFLTSDADLSTLTIVEADARSYGPMQAFTFSSGIDDRPCDEAPDSGILIQTPEGVGEVNLLVNEVEIRLGSTIYLQAGGSFMTVSVVEGQAVLTAGNVSQAVPAGTFVQIPLAANGVANGTPTFPQPYDYDTLLSLPVSIALPQSVSVAPAANPEEVEEAVDAANGLPQSGVWSETGTVVESTCQPNPIPVGFSSTYNITLTFSMDRSSFALDGYTYPGGTLTFTRVADNVYTSSYNRDVWTITFQSATTYINIWRAVYGDPSAGGCVYFADATGIYSGD